MCVALPGKVIELYEKEGKKEQSIGEFFGNYVLANQQLIEKVIN